MLLARLNMTSEAFVKSEHGLLILNDKQNAFALKLNFDKKQFLIFYLQIPIGSQAMS